MATERRQSKTSFRLRHDTKVRPRRLPTARIDRFGLVIADGARDDDVVTLVPIGRRRDAMLGRHLQGIDDAQYLYEAAPRRHRIDQHQLIFLSGPMMKTFRT